MFACRFDGVTLVLVGELDMNTASDLQAVALDGQRSLDIDAGHLTFIDSSGLRALRLLVERAHEHRMTVRWVDVHPQLRHLAELTAMTGLLDLPPRP